MNRSGWFRRHQAAAIVRVLPLLDEADILERNLRWYADSGIETVAFDNASSDLTAEIAGRALTQGLLAAFEGSDERLAWPEVTSALLNLAQQQGPDLIILLGADEFLEVADGTPLRDAMSQDLAAGHDTLRVDTMEFCLTDEDDEAEVDATLRMRRYAPYSAVLRDRGVRWSCGVEWLEPRRFQPVRAASKSPRRYISRHYPLRSPQQALARIRAGRLEPILAGSSAGPLAPLVRKPSDLLLPARKLPRYDEDHRWTGAHVLADLRLRSAEKLVRRMVDERSDDLASAPKLRRQLSALDRKKTELQQSLAERQRELASLKKKYGGVLLERDRLIASGALPTSERLAASADWYDQHYRLALDSYDSHYRDSVYLQVWEAIAGRLDHRTTILEIGCGTGQLAQLLFDRGIQQYLGFDFSEFAVGLARKRVPEADVQVADARTTPLVDQTTYDVALCTEVLEHLDDDLALLRRIRGGARVLATVPNFDSISHLRFFMTEGELHERYAQVLEPLQVTRISLARESAIFLLDGTARGEESSRDRAK